MTDNDTYQENRYPNGTRVVMRPGHPHHGKVGVISAQPDESGVKGMYLVEFEAAYAGGAYAYPGAFRRA